MNRDAIIRSMTLSPDVLEGFLAGLDTEIDLNRGGGLWTIREHLVHLATVQPMLHKRILQFRDENHPVMTPHVPESEDTGVRRSVEVDSALKMFREWREKQMETLDGLDAAVWAREGTHPEYKRYNLDILVAHTFFHDGFHLYRMEETALVGDDYLTTLP